MKKFIFLLILVFQFISPDISYSQEITDATKAAAAKAPLSKLAGTWWMDEDVKFVLNANGKGTAYFPNMSGSEIFKYSVSFTLQKKGDKIRGTLNGPNDGFSHTIIDRTRYNNADKDGIKIWLNMAKAAAMSRVECIEGTLLYIDNNYFAIYNPEWGRTTWFEKDAHFKKSQALKE